MARELKFIVVGILFLANLINLNSQIVASNSQELFNSLSLIDPHRHPDCTEPSDVKLFTFNNDRIEFNWAGPNAPKNGIRYLVHYRFIKDGLTYPWNDQLIAEGRSCVITRLQLNSTIEIELKKLCDGTDNKYSMSSDWVPVLKKELKDFNSRDLERGAEECSFITDARADRTSDSTYFVNITTSAPPNNSFWRYMVRYKSCTANPDYVYAFILTDTFTTVSCPHEGICEMQVRTIWGGQDTSYVSWCPWKDIILNGNNNPPPSAPCSNGTAANPTNTDPLASATTGDIFTVSGIPFIVDQIQGSNGTFSGSGTLSFPFGNKQLAVTFSSIHVNTDKEVIQGQVLGVQGGLQNYSIHLDTMSWSGKVCIPKENKEGWTSDGTWGATGLETDPYGFDINGKYKQLPPYDGYKTGDPYDEDFDPNGFDANGINKFTNSKYGPNGCSREGLDSLGHQCDPSDGKGPYWWLAGGGFSGDGKKFYAEIEDSLEINLIAVIDELKDSLETSLSEKNDLCDALRDTINDKITLLGYDPQFIKGSNNEYFDTTMSKHFASRPQELVTSISRRSGQKELEKAHVDLYQCDLEWTKLNDILYLLDQLRNDQANLDAFKAELKKTILTFTKEQVDQYRNEDEFLNWLKQQIEEKINRELPGSFGFIDSRPEGFEQIPNFKEREIDPSEFITSSMASLEPMNLAPADINKEIEFELKQGWTQILGTHKALIYEQMNIQRKLSSAFLSGEENKMPIVVNKKVLGVEEAIYFDNIRLGAQSSLMDVYFVLTIPTTGQKFTFGAQDLEFASGGLLSPGKLKLLNDFPIRINNTTMLVVEGTQQNTYVEFDCDGLKEISVQAYLEFCREFLTPLNPSTLEIDNNPATKVKAHFTTKMAGWGQFMATLTVDPFAITKAEDIKWVIDSATLDFSDQASPGITFPPKYNSEFVDPQTNEPLPGWRGVTIKKLQATLPKKFSKNNSQSITVGAYDVIVDGMGFTGTVAADSILSIDDGNIGGWALSINHISVDFVKNDLEGGSLLGQINVPIFTENLNYTAAFHPNNEYQFSVSTAHEMTADLWAAKVTVLPGSEIKVENKNNEFLVGARLNGKVTVDGALGGMNFKVPNIEFQNLIISNKDPYFSAGTWSVTGSAGIKIGGFEITADSIGLFKGEDNTETKLGFIAKIKLTEAAVGDIGASARLWVIGNLTNENDRQKWNFKKLDVSAIELHANIAGSQLDGYLKFYNKHTVFGTGFKGKISAKFKGLDAEINAYAQFGEIVPSDSTLPSYKYFFADAMVLLGQPIGFGAMGLYGFGGGLYYKMQRPKLAELQLANWTGDDKDVGSAPSGIEYIPNPNKGIGLRATLALSTQVKEAFNCVVTFDLSFFSGGGIAELTLEGNGQFMSPIDVGALPVKTDSTAPNSAKLSANVSFDFDFEHSEFDGDLQVFANVLGILRGSQPHNLMAWAKMHFGGGHYYINVGTPQFPCGLIFSLPILGDLAEAKSYLDIGTDLPAMISLADRGFPNLHLVNVPAKGRNGGTGFAFGSNLIFKTGERTFLIFYGSLELNLGFDLMVGKYSNVFCSNLNNAELGINGWYAQGQAWAKVSAEIGIKIKFLFIRKKVKILSFSAGVAIAAKLPNPFYGAGAVYGEFSILGGLVHGKCNFKFEIGEQCIPVDTTQDLETGVILALDPDDNSDVVDVNANPVATYYMPLEIVHYEPDPDDPSSTVKYLVMLKSATLKTKAGANIPFKIKMSKDSYYMTCKPIYYLPSKDTVQFEVKVDIYMQDNFLNTETRKVQFVTGERPDDIPLGNIVGSYPMQDMEYFYQNEYNHGQGYIVLDYGQPELFLGANEGDIVAQFVGSNGQIETTANYDYSTNEVNFSIPTLTNNSDYVFYLIDKRKAAKGDNGSNQGNNNPYGPKLGKTLCTFKFHTSQYNTLKEKISDFVSHSDILSEPTYKNVTLKTSIDEPFGNQELNNNWITGSVDALANKWYMSTPMIQTSPDNNEFDDCPGSSSIRYYLRNLKPENLYYIKSKQIECWLTAAGYFDWDDWFPTICSCFNYLTKNKNNEHRDPKYKWPTIYNLTLKPPVLPNDDTNILNVFYELPGKMNIKSSITTINLNTKTVK
jgi:hypothetical protein